MAAAKGGPKKNGSCTYFTIRHSYARQSRDSSLRNEQYVAIMIADFHYFSDLFPKLSWNSVSLSVDHRRWHIILCCFSLWLQKVITMFSQNLGQLINFVSTAMIVLTTSFVALRFFSRKVFDAGFGLDDWLSLASLMITITLSPCIDHYADFISKPFSLAISVSMYFGKYRCLRGHGTMLNASRSCCAWLRWSKGWYSILLPRHIFWRIFLIFELPIHQALRPVLLQPNFWHFAWIENRSWNHRWHNDTLVNHNDICYHLSMHSSLKDVGTCARSKVHTADTFFFWPIYSEYYYGLCNPFNSVANSLKATNACFKEGFPHVHLFDWLFVRLDLLKVTPDC